MTGIAFHFGAPNKLAYVCRLLRKAVANGANVMVLGPTPVVTQLNADLWAVSATEFVTHCLGTAESLIKERSAVVLASDMKDAPTQRQVLLNLNAEVPLQFDTFDRVIEVVSTDESDRNQARTRWRAYTERGYAITRHDLALRGAGA